MASGVPDISINVEVVAEVGKGLQNRADTAKTYTSRLFSSSQTAAGGNAAWLSAGSLTKCRQAWQDRVNQLIDQTRTMGKSIAGAAAKRTETDKEAAKRIREVIRDMSGRGTP
jgi:hypothetical protein